ncbi:hypothetical protein FOVG_10830 [Fusarium oxysporum f. sp. pisi HDV247]|uniref:Uncharacterized protein n=1 Tax=Fusarium oxysporum f. sp. pisi HDV247 TaxID=1080344 RepID=W9PH88_FUSOX|nr:hypothetical protein FOVG_10830 [Fusarium oxysporum f. sp. pisi HDV247]EXA39210.1 hypothetical protein FOVG_10830 [Fusarium oxysporum f. sp. pisi HDV247]
MPLSIPCGWREREKKKKHRLDRTSSIDAQIMDVGDAPSYGSDKMGWSTTALRRSCVWALSDYFAFHSRSRNLWDPFNRARVLFRCFHLIKGFFIQLPFQGCFLCWQRPDASAGLG